MNAPPDPRNDESLMLHIPSPVSDLVARKQRTSRLPAWLPGAVPWVSCLLAIGGVWLIFGRAAPPPVLDPPYAPNAIDAYGAVQELVKEYLVAPKTAEFPPFSKLQIQALYEGKRDWIIDGYVDSKNPLGVPLRMKWEAFVGFDPTTERYKFTSLKLRDEYVYISPEFQRLVKQIEDRQTAAEKKQRDAAAAERRAGQLAGVREMERERREQEEAARKLQEAYRNALPTQPAEPDRGGLTIEPIERMPAEPAAAPPADSGPQKPSAAKEKAAMDKLRQVLRMPNRTAQRRLLQAVIDQYPGTKAAAQADRALHPFSR